MALAFTTVVTFALVAIGAQAGMFGSGGKDGAPAVAAAGQATPTAEPTDVTQYIYIDQTPTPGPGSTSSGDGSSGGDGAKIEENGSASSSPSSGDDGHQESEHEAGDD